jgi:predicted Zn-dependent peptidase
VNLEFDEIGAKYNAYTSDEDTVYYGAVLPEGQSSLLDLYTDLMRPALRNEDFDMEKNVILEEIARADDSPQSILYYKTRELFYRNHPMAHRTLGSIDSIKALERDQMKAYFDRRYAPNNLKLTLAGNYDWDSAVAQTRELTRDWTPDDTPRDLTPPVPQADVQVERNDKFNRAHLYWMALGYSEQDPKRYAASVAGYAIGARRGSRLYWALTEPGIADSASFGHGGADGCGMFIGYASCDPGRVQEVADILRDVVRKAAEEGLTEAEVNGAKRKLAAAQALHDETPMGRLMTVGLDWVYRRELQDMDAEIDRTLAVTVDESNAILREIPLDRTVLGGLGPFDELH